MQNTAKISIKTGLGIIGMGVLLGTAASQSISIEPEYAKLYTYDTTFNISVKLSGDNIAGVQFNLNYNPTIIEAESVSEGNFLKNNSAVLTIPAKIDNNLGAVKFASARVEKKGVYGSGNIAEITFKIKNPGATDIKLDNVKIKDPDLNTINVKVNNAAVTVKNTSETTETKQQTADEKTGNTAQNSRNSKNNYFLIISIIAIFLLVIISKFIRDKSE